MTDPIRVPSGAAQPDDDGCTCADTGHPEWCPLHAPSERLGPPLGRTPSVAALRHAMRAHWLASIECDHEGHRDRPTCGCSRFDLGWHNSIADAIEAFNKHVEDMAGMEPDRACIHDQLRHKERSDKKYWRDRALRAEARAEDLEEELRELATRAGVRDA